MTVLECSRCFACRPTRKILQNNIIRTLCVCAPGMEELWKCDIFEVIVSSGIAHILHISIHDPHWKYQPSHIRMFQAQPVRYWPPFFETRLKNNVKEDNNHVGFPWQCYITIIGGVENVISNQWLPQAWRYFKTGWRKALQKRLLRCRDCSSSSLEMKDFFLGVN